MKKYAIFREYIWLVNTLRRTGGITFGEINHLWTRTEMSHGAYMPRATFNRHRESIEKMFGIVIDCDARNDYRYYIANPEVLREDSVQNWMLSTLSVNNVVSESLALQDRILMETAPVEGDLLKQCITAMRESRKLEIAHRRYGAEETRSFVIEPYCIKLFRQRWYVLGKLRREATDENPVTEWLTLFSLDRIREMHITEEHFETDPDFVAESYFADSYGVFVDSQTEPLRIVVRAYGFERYYLRDLPLHHSQRQCGEGEDWTDYEYFVRPTGDLVAKLMSYGSYVEVLEPQSLVEEMREVFRAALARYGAADEPESQQYEN